MAQEQRAHITLEHKIPTSKINTESQVSQVFTGHRRKCHTVSHDGFLKDLISTR